MPTYHRSIKKHTFNHHRLHRTVTTDYVRLFLSTDGNGSLESDIVQSYGGDIAHLTATPSSTYIFKKYDVSGSIMSGDDVLLNENDVYVKAWFDKVFNLTLQSTNYGTLTADALSGTSAQEIHLTPTPIQGAVFSGYTYTGSNVVNNTVTLTSDTTAKANFFLTSYNPSGEDAWYYVNNGQPMGYEETAIHDYTVTATNCDFALIIAGGTNLTAWGVPSPKRYVTINSTIYMPRANNNNWFEFFAVDDSYNPTGGSIPTDATYRHSMTGTHAVSVISDSTNNKTSAFVDRELVMTANTPIGNGYVGMHGMIDYGVTGRVTHLDMRSFSTYADAYNSTQVINN